jgi:cytochrome c-type protein NapB
MNKLISLIVLLSLVVIYACSSGDAKDVDNVNNEHDLGLVSSDVNHEMKDLLGEMPTYSSSAPGTSQRMERAFENAPPMIPHSTEGLVPITIKMNMCTTCHLPEVAVAMKSTPIPLSHMTKYRPDVVLNDGTINIEKNSEVTQKDLGGKLDLSRFNCTQCHVPQANIDVAVQNNFETVFRDNNLRSNSNLNDNIKEGVK